MSERLSQQMSIRKRFPIWISLKAQLTGWVWALISLSHLRKTKKPNYTTITCHKLWKYNYSWLLGLLLLNPHLIVVGGVKHINTPSDRCGLGCLPMMKSPETNWPQVTGWTECVSRFRGGKGPLAKDWWVSLFPGVQSEESTALGAGQIKSGPKWQSRVISLIQREFWTRTCKLYNSKCSDTCHCEKKFNSN